MPEINLGLCDRCNRCTTICTLQLISPDNPIADRDICIRCGHCYAVCPRGALPGIENFSQVTLDAVNKHESVEMVVNLVEKLNRNDLFTLGYYVIGFETDAPESIKADMKRLKEMDLDLCQICVLTPLLRTPLWDHISKEFGINKTDLTHFDTKHLVWNHPTMSRKEVNDLHTWCIEYLYDPSRFYRTMRKNSRKVSRNGRTRGLRYQIRQAVTANLAYYISRQYAWQN